MCADLTPPSDAPLDLEAALAAAVEAVEAGGAVTAELFAGGAEVHPKGDDGDIVTAADLAAERVILERLTTAYPDHAVTSEEAGHVGGASQRWRWLVDPLDGTNNYAVGLGAWCVMVCLTDRGRPVVAAICEPVRGLVTAARLGGGAHVARMGAWTRADPTAMGSGRPLSQATVSFVKGYTAPKDAELLALKARLDAATRRVLGLWAPGIGFAMVARGTADAVVVTAEDQPIDLLAGLLVATEAGAVVLDDAGGAIDPAALPARWILAHPAVAEDLRAVVATEGWPDDGTPTRGR